MNSREWSLLVTDRYAWSWHGNTFHITGPLLEESTGDQWIPRFPVIRNVDVFYVVKLNKLLNKHSNGRCFETQSQSCGVIVTLKWRHNERYGVSYHQPHDCLFSFIPTRRSKKPSKLPVTGLFGEIHRWPVNSPHKGPVKRKMLPCDDYENYYEISTAVIRLVCDKIFRNALVLTDNKIDVVKASKSFWLWTGCHVVMIPVCIYNGHNADGSVI